jgi:hypothetical protein
VCEGDGTGGGISGWFIGRERRRVEGWEEEMGVSRAGWGKGEGLLRARVGSIYRMRYTYFEY